jgi:hypothetical protein
MTPDTQAPRPISTRRLATALLAAACVLAPVPQVLAQQTASAPPAASAAPEAKAIDALKAMGAYLRSLKTFAVRADTTIDEVLTSGQKVQFAGTLDYRVQTPNRLRAEVNTDRRHREFYYDGKSLTQYAPRMKYYASIPAPGTLSELVQAADQKYGLEIPLADLFLWGTDKGGLDDITDAMYLGPARIVDRDCDHYAYRQQDVDWQVWIERGKRPLPCKMVITTTDEPSQPQYSAVLKWDLAPKLNPSTFTFAPPKDARKIETATVQPAANN